MTVKLDEFQVPNYILFLSQGKFQHYKETDGNSVSTTQL